MKKSVQLICLFAITSILGPVRNVVAQDGSEGSAQEQRNTETEQALMLKQHVSVFEQYCFDCHDASSSEAGINLEDLSLNISQDNQTAATWQKVLDAMNSKEMPPEDEEQVPTKLKTDFLDSLSNQMVTARSILSDSGGKITLRRLNRREYSNTLFSLLGVWPDVSNLPDDQAAVGFDTSGASLFFSSDQLEQYLAVARASLELAIDSKKARQPKLVRVQPEQEATERYSSLVAEYTDQKERGIAWKEYHASHPTGKKTPADFGFLDEYSAKRQLISATQWLPQLTEYLERPETKTGATMILTIKGGGPHRVRLPRLSANQSGRYTVRVRAGAYPDSMKRAQYLELSRRVDSSGGAEWLGWRKINATIDQPEVVEFTFNHPPDTRALYFVHQRTHQGRGDKNLWTLHRTENKIGTLPGTWVDWAEVEGPFPEEGRGEAIAEVLFQHPKDWNEERYAKEVIERFATRAFRSKAPTPEFLDKLFSQFTDNRAAGENVQDALIGPLSIVLTSPSFIYFVEGGSDESGGSDDKDKLKQNDSHVSLTAGSPVRRAASLTQSQLAVRLSYFLWSEPPDQELLELAQHGELNQPEILRQQTDRMLADQRATRFIEGFVHQWLQLERLEMFEFRATLYPDFDNATRESSREEIYETIKTLLREQLPLRTLLDADFVVINDVLADYYDLPAPQKDGHKFRKVELPEDSPRGGLLGTAAVMAMGSDGLRSSPVERGAWVLRHLLNDPPPPAPANVPQLARLDGEILGARELQKAHQEEPQCAQCHRKIDPIGYGLEHFDAAGLWREKEAVLTGRRQQETLFPIDSSGSLPSGEKFSDYFELRTAVASRRDDFARGFSESLISYALGRPYGFTDRPLVDETLQKLDGGNGTVGDFIDALIQSDTFQGKK